jgi:hypothetical protein
VHQRTQCKICCFHLGSQAGAPEFVRACADFVAQSFELLYPPFGLFLTVCSLVLCKTSGRVHVNAIEALLDCFCLSQQLVWLRPSLARRASDP